MHQNNALQTTFDYIIVGAGCAGLSLLLRMLEDDFFQKKSILLLDKIQKSDNDRTWSFWEKEKGYFEKTVSFRWDNLRFCSNNFDLTKKIAPFEYKMIRSKDFYAYCFSKIAQHKNVTIHYGEVEEMTTYNDRAKVKVGENIFSAKNIFSSILLEKPKLDGKIIYLLQHFKGWIIESDAANFDTNTATFMDFSIAQTHGTSFVYVMPMSNKKALVEYTLFTEKLLESEEYEKELKRYIHKDLGLETYQIVEEEFGIIPMTNFPFPEKDGKIIYIGMAGGATKASSGYTFNFIQKQCDALLKKIKNDDFTSLKVHSWKYQFYDSVLLSLIFNKKLEGKTIFARLFEKNQFQLILKFLDNETSIFEELRIFATLQIFKFFKESVKVIGNLRIKYR